MIQVTRTKDINNHPLGGCGFVLLTLILVFDIIISFYGPVAQLVRAPALQAGGQEFESPQVHKILK